jgi:hypothetical protein
MNTFRICKNGVSKDGLNWNLVCLNNENILKIAFINTSEPRNLIELLEIPDNLFKLIKWKVLYPNISLDESLPKQINGISIKRNIATEKILFDQYERMYYVDQNKLYFGLLYMKNFDLYAGDKKHLPKLHLSANCNAIESEFKFNCLYDKDDSYYDFTFTNCQLNNVVDRRTKNISENEVLEICKYCKYELENVFTDNELFDIIQNNNFPKMKVNR